MTQPEPQILRYQRWLAAERGLVFDATTPRRLRGAVALVDRRPARLLGLDLGLLRDRVADAVRDRAGRAPSCRARRWFPGAQVNYARQVLRHADAAHAAGHPAIVFQDERGMERGEAPRATSWPELRRQVAALAAALQALGVAPRRPRRAPSCRTRRRRHRRLPRLRQHRRDLVGVLARHGAGRGARPLPPDRAKVLIAVDGYCYGGATHDRRAVLEQLLAELPTRARAGARAPARCRRPASTRPGARCTTSPRSSPATRRFEPRVAAVRPPALDRLFERHDRPAEGDRARPRRRHARGAEGRRCTTTSGRASTPATASTGTARPAGSCGTRSSARCSAARTDLHLRRQPRRQGRRARLGHAVALRRRRGRDLLRRRRGVLRELPEGRRRAAARRPTCPRCARSARPARRSPTSATTGSASTCRRPAASASG